VTKSTNIDIAIVRRDDAALTVTVDEWIERYKQDEEDAPGEAIAELISFALQSSGCIAEFDVAGMNVETQLSANKAIDQFVGFFPKEVSVIHIYIAFEDQIINYLTGSRLSNY
jgi:hypothetical protein